MHKTFVPCLHYAFSRKCFVFVGVSASLAPNSSGTTRAEVEQPNVCS